ncbi:MAG: hypothetical protein ACI4KM_02625 [Oscillospiraceae bacterium]
MKKNNKNEAGKPMKVTSPEQLNDYVKVSNPGVWMILSGVVILLIAFFIWGFVGNLDSTFSCGAICSGGKLSCYISDSKASELSNVQYVMVDGKEYSVTSVSAEPVSAGALTEYVRHMSGVEANDWVYVVTAQANLPDGVHESVICTESVNPIAFLMN